MKTFVYPILVFLAVIFISFTSLKKDNNVPNVSKEQSTLEVLIENEEFDEINTNIDKLSNLEIKWLIDTLFTADSVPMDFLMDLHIHLNQREQAMRKSEYPADELYGSWNTEKANPYGIKLWQKDSSTKIGLIDSEFSCSYVHPFPGVVTSWYGHRDGRQHKGIDIDLVTGDTVKSCFTGRVRIAKRHGAYGNLVVVRHYNGLETYYAHLSKLKVKPGDVVDPGQMIGLGGNTGRSTGSHLHFEVRYKGIPLNPRAIINFRQHRLISDSITVRKTKYGYGAYPLGQEFHKVKRGDYLAKIANQYGVTISELCSWNGIGRNKSLRVGQRIRIEPLN